MRPDEKLRVPAIRAAPGGQVATALVALARWGRRVSYQGTFGGDEAGRISRASLAREGVELSRSRVRTGAPNQAAVILVVRGERTILWHRDARLAVRPAEVSPAWIRSARTLLLDGTDLRAATRAARIARKLGVPVVLDLDPEGVRPGVGALLRLTDHLIGSRGLGPALTGRRNPGAALRAMARLGPSLVALTLGRGGALARTNGREIRIGALRIRPVDTTGAGDVFHAGYIEGLLSGWTIERSLAFASAAAGLKCRFGGGRAGIVPRAEVLRAMGRLHPNIRSISSRSRIRSGASRSK